MSKNELFTDPNSQRIWDNYFKRVKKIIRVMDGKAQHETTMEIQDHLYQSFLDGHDDNEVSRLLMAIDRLGEPEEFLRLVVSDKFLKKGMRTLSPRNLILGLFYGMWGGMRQVIGGLVFGMGYLLTFIMGLMSFAKVFFPDKLGLFIWPDGSWIFGLVEDTTGSQDVLGYWIILLSLAITFVLYYILTLSVRIVLKKE